MPLVLMCGFPSSGKSTRAEELKNHIEKTLEKRVTVIGDHTTGVDKNDVYSDSKKEKIVRGNLKSAVQRDVKKDAVTVLDSLNYIRGFRYELYCITKECQTPHCVIFCDTSSEMASDWNKSRDSSEQYTQEVFDMLVQRFEEPKPNNRWDSPLFVVQSGDTLRCEEICDALFKRKAPPPNASTLPQPLSSTNFLYELDRITKDILSVIMDGQKTSVPGDQIKIPGAADKIVLTRTLTLAELQRNRRQFITYTKMHPVDDPGKISNTFVQYLNNTLG